MLSSISSLISYLRLLLSQHLSDFKYLIVSTSPLIYIDIRVLHIVYIWVCIRTTNHNC